MRVLVLGAAGMLGHKLVQALGAHEILGTVRTAAQAGLLERLPGLRASLRVLDAREPAAVVALLDAVRPTAVLNAVGVVKQRGEVDGETLRAINARLPHSLAEWCGPRGVRLVHFSTDCVFSGSRGGYGEADAPDARDAYGISKYEGEVAGPGCLTLRTSIIGRELATSRGLVEWFLSNAGSSVPGYARAVFSGLPTITLARTVATLLTEHRGLDGVYHVAADPIAKLDLLRLLDGAYGTGTTIVPDEAVQIDRSLDGSRFRHATGLSFPDWEALVQQMASDPTPYEEIRRVRT